MLLSPFSETSFIWMYAWKNLPQYNCYDNVVIPMCVLCDNSLRKLDNDLVNHVLKNLPQYDYYDNFVVFDSK